MDRRTQWTERHNGQLAIIDKPPKWTGGPNELADIMDIDLILPLHRDVCIALYTQCFRSVCGRNLTGDSGGIRTHDLRHSGQFETMDR